MKWVRSIAFLMLLAAFAACGDNSATVETQNFASLQTRQLQAIDSLMWQQPDSALAQIIDYMDCTDGACTVSTAHYAHLLLAELLYKNDYEQTNRAELLRAVAYYDSLCAENDDIAFLDARAHYMNGVGFYERDSVVAACAEYLKALEVMESHFDEKELIGHKARFMAMVYSHLTSLFSDLYLQEQCIFFAKAALKHYSKYGAPSWHPSWILTEIGIQHEIIMLPKI